MSIDEPVRKRLCTSLNQAEPGGENEENLHSFLYEVQEKIEECFPIKCLCGLAEEPLNRYINLSLSNTCDTELPEPDSCLLFLNFITWICQTFHDQLLSGQICSRIYQKALILVKHPNLDEAFFRLLRSSDENIQFSSVQAISSLLPLCHCGVDIPSPLSSTFLKRLLSDILDKSPAPASHSASLLDCLAPGDEAALDDFDFESPPRSKPVVEPGAGRKQEEEEEDSLRYRSLLLSILAGYVTHGSRQREEAVSLPSNCTKTVLEEEMLCQEMQVKCLVIKMMDPVWPQFTSSVIRVLSSDRSSLHHQLYLSESFKLWQSLISVRANLSFLESRVFSADLPRCLPLLRPTTPATVWRSVLDTVSECLCYGTTLGLQTCPPQEPCSLAHSIIRLVRFNKFLSQVPYKQSLGFGGEAGLEREVTGEGYDKGLVQKMVLIILKCVALTTREARVESSSGESDSSASSRESISSGGSDMIIIERTMAGMYKVLDGWIKEVLPVLPDQSLQESLLHLLQEQDDVLIEGLLCLLDTHMALYIPGKKEPETGLLDTNPTRGFQLLLQLVSRDSSVLLDFLVSNETCFLLYLLRFLKFIVKDWPGFVSSCHIHYDEVIQVLLGLQQSISRLLSKNLFPYNIGPVYRLLDKVNNLHRSQKNS